MRDEDQPEQLEGRLRAEARGHAYPPTPDLAGRERARLAARGPSRRGPALWRLAAAAALVLAALLAVPDVRAAALRALRVGVVSVVVAPAPPAPPPAGPTAAPPPALGLAGLTTLDEARALVDFPVRLPAYPPGLGPPDLVYLQDLDGAALIAVWLDPADAARPRLSLHALSSDVFVRKTIVGDETRLLAEVEVGGAPALWVRGPHLVETGRAGGRDIELRRIVAGDTLIWTDGGLTYRLETELPLEEALRVAESLR